MIEDNCKYKAVAFYSLGELVVKSTTKRLCEFAIVMEQTLSSHKRELKVYKPEHQSKPGSRYVFAFTKSDEVGNRRIKTLSKFRPRGITMHDKIFTLVPVERGTTKSEATKKAIAAAEKRERG